MKNKLILIILILIPIMASCDQKSTEKKSKEKTISKFLISGETPIDSCSMRNMKNKIIFLMSQYCPHCHTVKPIILKTIKEEKLEKYYEEYDLSQKDDRAKFDLYGLQVQFVPVLIVNCEVLPGAKPEEEYVELLKKFKMSL